ncbi:MAG: hypothetical protein J5382_01835 [Bacteroidales bacterium]|nr:hypothetical protein [Bacteroidales bacterium]
MKNIVFTICSNNYLGQAKVLSDSVYEYSGDRYVFYVVLCDAKNKSINYDEFHAKFIEAADLNIENFDWMRDHYNIIELNTAIKPFAFKYLIDKGSPEYIHYLDPDTCTYAPLSAIEEEIGNDSSILLTPHSLEPIVFDGDIPNDITFLNAGIYNLGFLGIHVDNVSSKMLDWWCGFLKEHCFIKTEKGMFVDQLPMNLVPLYFDRVKVSRHRGFNVAYWNLHERSLIYDNDNLGRFFVQCNVENIMDGSNSRMLFPLIFYHFSNYSPSQPGKLTGIGHRNYFDASPALRDLYLDYTSRRNRTNEIKYKSVPCIYVRKRNKPWLRVVRRIVWLIRGWSDRLYDKVR